MLVDGGGCNGVFAVAMTSSDHLHPRLRQRAMATAAMGKDSEGARVRARMGHCWRHAIVPCRIRPKDVKVVPNAVILPVPDIKVLDMPSFLMPKLDMPKTDVPSPPKFNVPAHPPPKPVALLSLSVPEFKVLDAAPKFNMSKVDILLFLMPKFDVPNTPAFALPRWTCQISKSLPCQNSTCPPHHPRRTTSTCQNSACR